ncbi:hypothetical protein Hte_008870 [Hypoxylon texense]
MVENPGQAAYIIGECHWQKNSSPACAEFLQNLPENNGLQVSIESGSALRYLALGNDSSSSSSSSSPSSSRFLTLKHVNETPTSDVEGRATFTAFLIPRKDDSERRRWYEKVRDVFGHFLPLVRTNSLYGWPSLTVWFWVLVEDDWMVLVGEDSKASPRRSFEEMKVHPLPIASHPLGFSSFVRFRTMAIHSVGRTAATSIRACTRS